MPRRVSLFLLLIALAPLGCRPPSPRAERQATHQAVINLGTDPRTLDPSLATDVASARALLFFQRGLFMLDDEGKPRPELAESWEVSPDSRIYQFKLREAYWTNGQRVTADDFLYTWTERVLNPEFGAEYAHQIYNYIAGARAYYENPELGTETVRVWALAPDQLYVELEHPTPYFLELLAHHAYFPVCRAMDEQNADWARRAETYVGCGPFVLAEYQPGARIVARRNPQYWNAAAVKMEQVTLRMIEEESTARIAFENGEIDATEGVPRAELDSLRGSEALAFSTAFSTYYLNLNCQKEPLRDVRVRRALALALNRREITEKVTRAGEQPAFFISPPGLYEAPPAPTFADADFDEARRLLAEAGYPGGQGFPRLRYIYNMTDTHQLIAQVIQETWRRELGIEMTVENQEFKTLIENRRQGNFDVARAGWVADFPDPLNFLEIFASDSDTNDSFWRDPAYDALLFQARAETDPDTREAILRQADLYLIEQMPIVPIYIYSTPYLRDPALEGFHLNPMAMFDPVRLAWRPPPS
ncbi:MAG: Oligopeptide-binding protein OppA precursor [candidate division BRC1 bacterium ADurb.BinA292]|nr:MAG: Oligopeptide-binding protein OppA precursor [candidate division BRC1 bacterium ADurb.BinA292]